MDRLDRLGVTVHVADPVARGERPLPVDDVVDLGTPTPDLALHDEIAALGLAVVAVGDCREIGLIRGAVADATQSQSSRSSTK